MIPWGVPLPVDLPFPNMPPLQPAPSDPAPGKQRSGPIQGAAEMVDDLAQLITRARDHCDSEARNELINRYYPAVRRMVHADLQRQMRYRRPWLWAMFSTGDIVQDVFLGAIRDLKGFLGNDEGALIKYLSTLVRNRLIDAVRFYEANRRDARRLRRDSTGSPRPHPVAEDPTPSVAAALAEQVETFREVLESLSIRDRTLISLRLENEESFGEIAEQLSMPTADAARKAFVSAQARVLVKLRARGFSEAEKQ